MVRASRLHGQPRRLHHNLTCRRTGTRILPKMTLMRKSLFAIVAVVVLACGSLAAQELQELEEQAVLAAVSASRPRS